MSQRPNWGIQTKSPPSSPSRLFGMRYKESDFSDQVISHLIFVGNERRLALRLSMEGYLPSLIDYCPPEGRQPLLSKVSIPKMVLFHEEPHEIEGFYFFEKDYLDIGLLYILSLTQTNHYTKFY